MGSSFLAGEERSAFVSFWGVSFFSCLLTWRRFRAERGVVGVASCSTVFRRRDARDSRVSGVSAFFVIRDDFLTWNSNFLWAVEAIFGN